MANPVEEDRVTSVGATGDTSLVITLPSGIVSGEGLLATIAVNDAPGATWPAGWTELFNIPSSTNKCAILCGYRDADGGEGSTITVTIDSSEQFAAVAARYSGVDFGAAPPEYVAGVDEDPANITPSGGADDYKILAPISIDTKFTTITTFPSGYTNTLDLLSDEAGAAVRLGMCEKDLTTASSENPGAYSLFSSNPRITSTIAITPVSAGGNTITADQDEEGDSTSVSFNNIVSIGATVAEEGDSQSVAFDSIVSIGAAITEEGDTQSVSFVGVAVSEITADQLEEGDSQSVSVNNIVSINSSITEEGDTQSVSFVGVLTSTITADQQEEGDAQSVAFDNIVSITASQAEEGDSQAVSFVGATTSTITANQQEEGDSQSVSVNNIVSINVAVIEAGDNTAVAFLAPSNVKGNAKIDIFPAYSGQSSVEQAYLAVVGAS